MSLPREIRQAILLIAILDNGEPVNGYSSRKLSTPGQKFALAVGVAYQTLLICTEVTKDKGVAIELTEDVEWVGRKWEEEYEVVHKACARHTRPESRIEI